jgi:hypothetical protein
MDRSVRLAAGPARIPVDGEDVVAPARDHRGEELPDEPVADHEHASMRHPFGAAQDARERLDHRPADVVHVRGEVDPPVCAYQLGEAARPDGARTEGLAGRLVSGVAALAFAAGQVVHERDAPAADLGDDLVTEDFACVLGMELLEVGTTEAAREHAYGAVRLGHVGELRPSLLVEDDGPHALDHAHRHALDPVVDVPAEVPLGLVRLDVAGLVACTAAELVLACGRLPLESPAAPGEM